MNKEEKEVLEAEEVKKPSKKADAATGNDRIVCVNCNSVFEAEKGICPMYCDVCKANA